MWAASDTSEYNLSMDPSLQSFPKPRMWFLDSFKCNHQIEFLMRLKQKNIAWGWVYIFKFSSCSFWPHTVILNILASLKSLSHRKVTHPKQWSWTLFLSYERKKNACTTLLQSYRIYNEKHGRVLTFKGYLYIFWKGREEN